MEIYNDKICITGHELILSPRNPNGIITKNNYDRLVQRGRIRILRRGGGEGCPALIELSSLPEKYRVIAEAKYPMPEHNAHKNMLMSDLEPDAKAIAYYESYVVRYDEAKNDKGLPAERQAEYANHAAILNALGRAWQKHVAARRKVGKRPEKIAFWETRAKAVEELPEMWANTLPTNGRRLCEVYEKYQEEGYESLISKAWANQNTVKIVPEAGDWLVAQWASMIDRVTIEQLHARYNQVCEGEGWKPVKSAAAIRAYLHREDVQPRWYGARYGELASKEMYARQHRTVLPQRRDSLWYSDGTKLNYYYKDAKGNIMTCQVYEVIDVYSEVLLGYHISKSEDYEAQFMAYKMAMKRAGHKPYEIKFDNQGGHKKLNSADLLTNIARLAIRTQPYNGKSKTIESIFGRFQSQILHKDWFFTGQNITAKKRESHSNMEFILANASKLPTLEEIKELYKVRREEWNAAPHSKTGIPREQMYATSVNEETPAIDALDMINMFGIMTSRTSTYRASGIEIEVKGKTYAYEVLDKTGMPDMAFNCKNINRKFFVKYSPDDMSIVSLYEDDASGVRFVTMAESYRTVHRATQDQVEGDRSFIAKMDLINKQERIRRQVETSANLEKHNVHPNQHGLVTPNLKGVSGKNRKVKDVGEIMKEVSNMDEVVPTVPRGIGEDEKARRKAARLAEKEQKAAEQSWEDEQREYLKEKRRMEMMNLN